MTLLEMQRTMADALMTPMAKRVVAKGIITPNSRLTSRERLEIYRRSYWSRLLDSFRDDFPGLRAVLGRRRFEQLAPAYLADCPSQSFTLRDLGSQLEKWLTANPRYGGINPELALDMVRLEWAHIVAFDGAEQPVLEQEQLVGSKPNLRVGLQPHIGLLQLSYPVDEIRVGCETRQKLRAKPESILLAVHRQDFSVYYRRLSREEFGLLNALRSGRSIAEAIECALAGSSTGPDEIPELLTNWFQTWSRFGWLTVRERSHKGVRE